MQLRNRNAIVAGLSLGVVAGMIGLAYASVPLYRLFCQVTGFAGTTQRAEQAAAPVPGTSITVRFDANVNESLPWSFAPEQSDVKLALGETVTAVYRVRNLSNVPLVGTATFNVTPFSVGPYFDKLECFCFARQRLAPGESADLPVTFFVDPALVDDPETAEIRSITLSYTFFRAPDEAAGVDSSAASTAAGAAAN
jgi:cytochrome c oxidase assembly protein subunit 11